ncbi:hypothetical protein LEP1GSC060_0462 [Leptospira weilii serovar Ranarum str. ICFT]|uniref:Uncharacterized protein n=1 Tax=Leptospira weilii serovar Ranarum str. ICFT TaxID=1218598 RepID=N1WV33_9LEPT|nr:hypothetical protein LEP1GSC060_0462 [Leptospira weilii serovar Ranarum str. ICFT]
MEQIKNRLYSTYKRSFFKKNTVNPIFLSIREDKFFRLKSVSKNETKKKHGSK